MKEKNTSKTSRFGFRLEKVGIHTSRTIMLEDLQHLLSHINNPDATRSDYIKAIVEDNCLGKRSGRSRKLAASHLVYLYSLDPSILVFRSLHYFWNRDIDGQPILALLCAYGRDALLRMSASFIIKLEKGTAVSRTSLEKHIEKGCPDRFSRATLISAAQNLNSTWTKSGHLRGKARKMRVMANATPGSVSYALFLGYLNGIRGQSLFTSEYATLLDCPPSEAMALAEDASRRGWIIMKRIGDVVEVQFPKILTAQEMGWINEQD
ncbi:MAG: hypothetical protein QM438_12150 [Euryarchaeota archaeon]|jgi:hypothetical protein|uniref:hypothetical protein n=1 Tax=Methanothrix sp. TaxID=90426 RepID=UPI0032B01D02|nr:hypothetical protein [Euryarchaeota archaeon]